MEQKRGRRERRHPRSPVSSPSFGAETILLTLHRVGCSRVMATNRTCHRVPGAAVVYSLDRSSRRRSRRARVRCARLATRNTPADGQAAATLNPIKARPPPFRWFTATWCLTHIMCVCVCVQVRWTVKGQGQGGWMASAKTKGPGVCVTCFGTPAFCFGGPQGVRRPKTSNQLGPHCA